MAQTWPQHSSPRWLNIGQHRPNIGQHRPKVGPMAQHGPDLAQHKPKMGSRWFNIGPTWFNMGTTCAHYRPGLLLYRQAPRIMPASVQHSPPWVCAENLGPIFPHHKPEVVAWPAPGCQASAFKAGRRPRSPCPCRRPSVGNRK